MVMDTGILGSPTPGNGVEPDVTRDKVATAGGASLKELIASKDKGKCIQTMILGAEKLARQLFAKGRFLGVIGIGGAQGTDIGTAAMRALPFGVPKFMISTVATGQATFGPYVGTRDIIMMHSVADLQGLNIITTRVLKNAAAAVCGMVKEPVENRTGESSAISIAMSTLGTTTLGALRARETLEKAGFEVVAFHQNGTGGIAMEDMISEGMFKGVLDINLHEIGDSIVGGLHGAIRDYRLESAGRMGLPQVIAPGSINYTVQGPYASLSEEMKKRKYIIHNPNLTLVRLSQAELKRAAELTARKLNAARGPIHVFIPLKGFSYPDREGLDHWEPEGNSVFIDTLKQNLNPSIPFEEIDDHINDRQFIDPVVEKFIYLVNKDPDGGDSE